MTLRVFKIQTKVVKLPGGKVEEGAEAKGAAEAISVQVAWLFELPANRLGVLVDMCCSGSYAPEGDLLGPNQKEPAKVTK